MKTSFQKFMDSTAVQVELGEVKVELNLLNDGVEYAKQLNDIAIELKGNKQDVAVTMRRIEGLTKDGIAIYQSLQTLKKRLDSLNKEIGANALFPEFVQKAEDAWSNAHTLKI